MAKALICGITGQDGAYLARLLLDKGYEVHGTARDAQMANLAGLDRVGVRDQVKLHSMALNDFRSVLQVFARVQPDEIYNLAGQSSVGLSFEQPVETLESISVGTLNLLEVIRFTGRPVRFYNAGSSECFGTTDSPLADETMPFRPRSPYAVAKATAFWEVANYREAYNLFACTGILFNHESPLRPERFVTRKIVKAACRIAVGSDERLMLGNIGISRDWGWAPEYVEAMWLMLQQPVADDYVVATGTSHTVREFVQAAFTHLEIPLAWQGSGLAEQGIDPRTGRVLVAIDPKYFRPAEVESLSGDAGKARRLLGWEPKTDFAGLVAKMVDADLALTEQKG
jgi:GDPmannose 4,6-dehydratase